MFRRTLVRLASHGGPQPLRKDPGIEAWNDMREGVWKTFKFTNRTTRISIVMCLVVPFIVYKISESTDQLWDLRGKQRGEPLANWGKYSLPASERNKAVEADDEEEEE